MKYELYEQIHCNENKIILYKLETDNLSSISSYMENYPLDDNSKYIVLNNNPSKPINYLLLGFTDMPTENEHYDIILECKFAKEYYCQIKTDNIDNYYSNYETGKRFSNNIFNVASLQTDIYFEKYNNDK